MPGFNKNFSPEFRERHYQFLISFFGRPVHRITEMRDGAVFNTQEVGTVAYRSDQRPFRPGTTSG